MNEAFKVFCDHYPWESTLLLMLNKESRAYLKPRMCWKQAYGLDKYFLAELNSPPRAELAARHGNWDDFYRRCKKDKHRAQWTARIMGKYMKVFVFGVVDWRLLSCAAFEYCNLELIESMCRANFFRLRATWKFETLPIKTLDALKDKELVLREAMKNAVYNDNLELVLAILDRGGKHPKVPSLHKEDHHIGPLVGKYMLENGWTVTHNHLIAMIRDECFGFAKEILARVGWRRDSMSQWFIQHDNTYDGSSQMNFLLENKCPWDLSKFYQQPDQYYELSLVLEKHGLKFDQATLDDLCRRATKKNNLFCCAKAIVDCRNPFGGNLDTTPLIQAAARLGKKYLLQVQHYPWDGQLWEVAVLAKCDSSINFFESIQLPWTSKFQVNWSRLCKVSDWRFLHNAGSPCRQRHSV